ncbi:MAG: response regulator [Kofleriaceae bacterium]
MAGVLVVDDNVENRALAAATLGDEGITVEVAATGEEALETFARMQPECILLDIGLPGMDGVTVCERIRARPDGERVAILFITGRRDVESFDRALRAGGDDFLTKPFRPQELLVRIQTARRLREMATERDATALELKRQRDELQRLQLQKEQLTEFLVHDLKNPVNSIELLARRAMRAEPETGKKIREETRGLMRMITNLLDMNKAQEGLLVPARRKTDLAELVRDAIGELEERAKLARVVITPDVQVASAEIDRELIGRVLANLVENAVRHSPEHSTITVRVKAPLTFEVADVGPGVPIEQRETIFDRFVTGGTRANHGLGLAFCRVAVAAHGGRIYVDDSAVGAVFVVELG